MHCVGGSEKLYCKAPQLFTVKSVLATTLRLARRHTFISVCTDSHKVKVCL